MNETAMNARQPQVLQQPGDPNIYLQVMGQWYFYDPRTQPLGEGAMGTVYLGFSCHTHQRIAVKRVKDIYANHKTIRERARQEASLSFSHPNLVQMIGLCEWEPDHGPIFILSTYVAGITLEAHVKEQLARLPTEERAEKIANEICYVLDALQYLHARGVVHRDIKPSNIMLENGTTVKLMDLGIARMNGGNKYSSYGFIGTPQYAAPEQILRESQNIEINGKTDIYSLGVTFYELLAGVNPFQSEVEAEILTNQMTKKLPPHELIPKKLYRVLLKATEKDPARRYANALDFKAAIRQAFDDVGTPDWTDWMRRHANLLVICGMAILFILAIILILLLG